MHILLLIVLFLVACYAYGTRPVMNLLVGSVAAVLLVVCLAFSYLAIMEVVNPPPPTPDYLDQLWNSYPVDN